MNRKALITVVLACALGAGFDDEVSTRDGRFFRTDGTVEFLASKDPVRIAERDLSKGRVRFLAVAGFAVVTPGIDQDRCRAAAPHVAIIEGTSDAGDTRHFFFMERAQAFAKAYNEVVKAHLESRGRFSRYIKCEEERRPQ